jgi:Spy/CpxP family protein refolding chaperone
MKRTTWRLMGACVVVGLTAFLVTVKAMPTTGHAASNPAVPAPLSQWLDLSAAQQRKLANDDPTYDADWVALRDKVWAEREALATMMQAPNAKEAEVLTQVDRVSAAENALQRRITQHVLRLRQGLTTQQQLNLMGLCANAVRGHGYGRGMGMGMGRGMGNGRGYRGGRGAQ